MISGKGCKAKRNFSCRSKACKILIIAETEQVIELLIDVVGDWFDRRNSLKRRSVFRCPSVHLKGVAVNLTQNVPLSVRR